MYASVRISNRIRPMLDAVQLLYYRNTDFRRKLILVTVPAFNGVSVLWWKKTIEPLFLGRCFPSHLTSSRAIHLWRVYVPLLGSRSYPISSQTLRVPTASCATEQCVSLSPGSAEENVLEMDTLIAKTTKKLITDIE